MQLRVIAILGSFFALLIQPAPARAQTGWDRVHQLTTKDAWLAAVYADEERGWLAAGNEVVVFAVAGQPRESPLTGLMVVRFGRDNDGELFAVGSHGAIWMRTGPEKLTLLRQSRPAGTRGKIRDEDQLISIQRVHTSQGDVFMTYGVANAVFVRSTTGWDAPTNVSERGALIREAMAPSLRRPSRCDLLQWTPFDRGNGLLQCHDGRGFVVAGSTLRPVGTLPKRCSATLLASAILGDDAYVVCGDEGRLWRYAGAKWAVVPGLRGLRAVSANSTCVVTASENAVWQYCRDTSATGPSS